MAIEFGEKLLWKVRQRNRLEKHHPRWEYGSVCGREGDQCEIWVDTKDGP